jgi:hypothetical protein
MKITFTKNPKNIPIRHLEPGTIIKVNCGAVYIVPEESYMFALILENGCIVGTVYNMENFLFIDDRDYEILGKVSVVM